jgi:hypothetical protein
MEHITTKVLLFYPENFTIFVNQLYFILNHDQNLHPFLLTKFK